MALSSAWAGSLFLKITSGSSTPARTGDAPHDHGGQQPRVGAADLQAIGQPRGHDERDERGTSADAPTSASPPCIDDLTMNGWMITGRR